MRRRIVIAVATVAAAAAFTASAARAAEVKPPCTGDPAQVTRLATTPVTGVSSYLLYALPAAKPKGLVVVDHGIGHTPYDWSKHLTDMARQDGVIAVAVHYHGETDIGSPPTGSSGWFVNEGAEDTINAAHFFDEACPGLPLTVLYSVSMGGNTAGLALAKAGAANERRKSGQPLFDYWIDVEGVSNVIETYLEARAIEPSGNSTAKSARAAIEADMGGPIETVPAAYARSSVVARGDDIVASGVKGVTLVHGFGDGLVPYNQPRELEGVLAREQIPFDFFSVATRGSGEPGTTLDEDTTLPSQLRQNQVAYTSPFAGHASESSDNHLVGNTGFARLGALVNDLEGPCRREFLVDGALDQTVPNPSTTPAPCPVSPSGQGVPDGDKAQGGDDRKPAQQQDNPPSRAPAGGNQSVGTLTAPASYPGASQAPRAKKKARPKRVKKPKRVRCRRTTSRSKHEQQAKKTNRRGGHATAAAAKRCAKTKAKPQAKKTPKSTPRKAPSVVAPPTY